jgi:protein-S-isoprenylcysteine O-methyltransferase Ste14
LLYLRAVGGLIAPLIVDVVVPAALLHDSGGHLSIGAARYLGLVLMVPGTWMLLDSIFARFAHEGRGTLNPLDPPKFVVRGGAYRVVRNPMYLANVAIITGSALLFRSWYLLVWAAALLIGWHVFVLTYEEPTLRRLFGEDYERYQGEVGRWIPRRRARRGPRA